jgi:hypothetical protein
VHANEPGEVVDARQHRARAAAEQQPQRAALGLGLPREQQERREADAAGDADRVGEVERERLAERAGADDAFARLLVAERACPRRPA